METGEFRAPKDKSLAEYHLLCLDHVRSYNAAWNFHEGLDDEEMEREFRSAATWDRPTWKLGLRPAPGPPWHDVFDPFDLFQDALGGNGGPQGSTPPHGSSEHEARQVLGLQVDYTLEMLKTRYKELVKLHHPDANGGSQDAENRMKNINAAYQALKSSLAS